MWAGFWSQDQNGAFKSRVRHYIQRYNSEGEVKAYFDGVMAAAKDFGQLIEILTKQPEFFVGAD